MNRCLAPIAIMSLFCITIELPRVDDVPNKKPKTSQESQTIRVKTELMEVRTVVTDRKGRIIEDLKKEDFELRENDQPQEIAFFSISHVESHQSKSTAAGSKSRESTFQGNELDAAQNKSRQLQGISSRLREPPARSTLLYVDNLHLSFSSLNRVKEALRHFIDEQMTEQDIVGIATSSQTIGLAQQFTWDRQLLSHAIEQIQSGPISGSQLFTPVLAAGVLTDSLDAYRLAVDIVRREDNIQCPCALVRSRARGRALQVLSEGSYFRKTTLAILKDFAQQMTHLPGKRMIVVFSNGFTMLDNDGGIHNEQLQPVIDRAVRSGVAIYSIDAKGLQTLPGFDASNPSESNNTASNPITCPDDSIPDPKCDPPDPALLTTFMSLSEREELNGLYAMAKDTGGKMYNNTNDLASMITKAVDANRFYYILSYYLQPARNQEGFRNIRVRLPNHPEYNVQTIRGFLSPDTLAKSDEYARTPQQRLIEAINAPLPLNQVNVSARLDFIENEDDDKKVTLTVDFEGDKFQYREQDQRMAFGLEILSFIYNASGKQIDAISAHVEGTLTPARLEQARASGYRFSRRLGLKPGIYQARIGVREEGTERMGTAVAWIEVPEMSYENLEVSSLIMRNTPDNEPTASDGISMTDLEQVKLSQGIPLYGRDVFCEYYFRVRQETKTPADAKLVFMGELFKSGRLVKEQKWLPIFDEERNLDRKGWFEVHDDMDLSGLEPGIYELRVSVKDPRLNKTIQRTAVFRVE